MIAISVNNRTCNVSFRTETPIMLEAHQDQDQDQLRGQPRGGRERARAGLMIARTSDAAAEPDRPDL
jgi:hypothetical protein